MTGWQQWLFVAGYTVALLGLGGVVGSRLGWRQMRRWLAKLDTDSQQRAEELAQLRHDVGEVAAYLFANEDEPPPCDYCGIDEIVAANPQLRDLTDKGWLLAQHDGERE